MGNFRLSRRQGGARRRHVAWLALLPLAVALTACGASTSASGSSSTSTTSPATSFQAYLTCLEQHGVTVPTAPAGGTTGTSRPSGGGGFPGGGFFGNSSNPTVAKAQQACASLRPAGRFGGSGTSATALRVYLNCLEIHGVTVPTGSASGSFLRTMYANPTATEKTAMAACASLRPSFSRGSSPATSTSTTAPSGG
jgi:hypothetical protein